MCHQDEKQYLEAIDRIFSVRSLQESIGALVQEAEACRLSLVVKDGKPVFVVMPMDEELLEAGRRARFGRPALCRENHQSWHGCPPGHLRTLSATLGRAGNCGPRLSGGGD